MALAHETIVAFGRSVSEDAGSEQSGDLYQRARGETRDIALEIESLSRSAVPTHFLGEQIVALSLMITAMKYSIDAQGPDEAFLVGVVGACDELYRHHLLVLEGMQQSETNAIEVISLLKSQGHEGSKVDINQLCTAVAKVASGLPSIF